MWDEIAALVPPLVVATAFCLGVFALLRQELAERSRRGERAGNRVGDREGNRGDDRRDSAEGTD